MPKYEIRFEFMDGYNRATIEADSVEAAMEQAKTMDAHEAEFGDFFDRVLEDLDCILVRDEETGDEELVYILPERRAQIHAPDMLQALKDAEFQSWVANAAITDDIEALRKICLDYADWWNNTASKVIEKAGAA